MHAQFDTTATTAIVRLGGHLTFAQNGAFRRVVEGLEQAAREHVVFDLGALEFIDSAGLGLLLVARDLTTAQGGRVMLANVGGQVARMLRLAKFCDFFTLDAACAQV